MSFTEFTQKAAAFIMSIVLLLSTSLFGKVYPPEDAEDNTCFTPEGQTMTLIDDNASEYKIIYGSEASLSEANAARILARYLHQIRGFELTAAADSVD